MLSINFTLSDDFFEVKLYPTIRTTAAAAATLACGAFKTNRRFSRRDIFARFRCVKVSSVRTESFLSESKGKQKAMLFGALMLLNMSVPYASHLTVIQCFSSLLFPLFFFEDLARTPRTARHVLYSLQYTA
jgi:hypothetical protein